MWLSLMKPITLRPVSSSISRLTSFFMIICQRWRRSSTVSLWPASASVCSPRVSVSCSTTNTPLGPSVVFAFVGPRPVVRASARTTVFEIWAASSPSRIWLSVLIVLLRSQPANGVPRLVDPNKGAQRRRTCPAFRHPKTVRVTSPRAVTESTRDAGKNRVISRDDDDTVGQIADLFSAPRTTVSLCHASALGLRWRVEIRAQTQACVRVSVDCERSRHQPGVAALDCWVAKRPGKEPQGRLVQLGQASGVDRILHARERPAPVDHALDLLGGSVKGEWRGADQDRAPFWSRGCSERSTADS